ncbi:hypothetical protein RHMOL_Rhmol02G0204000 [Rhododendron molle]|uniref:Uncharacterized protein n=1 Tax=Rhododendron molle TaxID=49168 RepID=A0ACC0PU13_RHOML|nr:hypothetical protein RHMOL_Rhmol02G0204000 [Rhododendron molle]
MKNPSRYKPKPVGEPNPVRPSFFPNSGGAQWRMHSPVLSEWGFYRKTSRRKKSTKSYMVDETDGEEGDETDMAKFRVKPTNVEGGARLKQKDVDLDDEVVEDTPPSKIRGMRPQENHDVEGSSNVRTRFGSVARGIKDKHP